MKIRNEIDSLLKEEDYNDFQFITTICKPYKLYLSPKYKDKRLNWYEAMEYAKSLDGDLPTIGELLYLYNNYSELFTSTGYWSSTEHNSIVAKRLDFYYGNTKYNSKYGTYYVRVVKRVFL